MHHALNGGWGWEMDSFCGFDAFSSGPVAFSVLLIGPSFSNFLRFRGPWSAPLFENDV